MKPASEPVVTRPPRLLYSLTKAIQSWKLRFHAISSSVVQSNQNEPWLSRLGW